jgi:hypothetical protein
MARRREVKNSKSSNVPEFRKTTCRVTGSLKAIRAFDNVISKTAFGFMLCIGPYKTTAATNDQIGFMGCISVSIESKAAAGELSFLMRRIGRLPSIAGPTRSTVLPDRQQ